MLTALSSESCGTEEDVAGLCMKKACEDNWERGLREEAEGSFQKKVYSTILMDQLKLEKMKWQYFSLFRWS